MKFPISNAKRWLAMAALGWRRFFGLQQPELQRGRQQAAETRDQPFSSILLQGEVGHAKEFLRSSRRTIIRF